MLKRIIIAVIILGTLTAAVRAVVPTVISFRGKLLNGAAPVTGTQTVTFTMYDANDNLLSATGWPQTKSVSLDASGVFITTLESGVFPFDGAYRLGITYNGTNLTPHQFLTAVPYAITARDVYSRGGYFAGPVTVGTTDPANAQLRVSVGSGYLIGAAGATAVYAKGTVVGISAEGVNTGLYATGGRFGVYASAEATAGAAGVRGWGFYGVTGSGEIGVAGTGSIGVLGQQHLYFMFSGQQEAGYGVCGLGSLTQTSYGVVGTGEVGVYGVGVGGGNNSIDIINPAAAVYGYSLDGDALYGEGGSHALRTHGPVIMTGDYLDPASEASRVLAISSAGEVAILSGVDPNLLNTASSLRYKERISDLPIKRDQVLSLRPVSFTWKNNKKPDIGLIAEEVEKEVKPLVTYNEETGSVEGVKYDKLPVYLLGVLQAQSPEIREIEARLASLEAEGR
jgi:hypothetical protein